MRATQQPTEGMIHSRRQRDMGWPKRASRPLTEPRNPADVLLDRLAEMNSAEQSYARVSSRLIPLRPGWRDVDFSTIESRYAAHMTEAIRHYPMHLQDAAMWMMEYRRAELRARYSDPPPISAESRYEAHMRDEYVLEPYEP